MNFLESDKDARDHFKLNEVSMLNIGNKINSALNINRVKNVKVDFKDVRGEKGYILTFPKGTENKIDDVKQDLSLMLGRNVGVSDYRDTIVINVHESISVKHHFNLNEDNKIEVIQEALKLNQVFKSGKKLPVDVLELVYTNTPEQLEKKFKDMPEVVEEYTNFDNVEDFYIWVRNNMVIYNMPKGWPSIDIYDVISSTIKFSLMYRSKDSETIIFTKLPKLENFIQL